jgi:signal transduction histidine kinase
MAEKTTNVLIVGAGRAGTALIKMFQGDETVRVVGVIDKDEKAVGIKLARELKIPTADQWKELIKDGSLDEIINVTGSSDVQADLLKEKPDQVCLGGRLMAKAIWFLAKEYEIVEQKIQEAKEDVEAHEWGVQKTNEAIKTLYAELEEKNKELQELDRLKSDFISTVSHELRTPLAITKEGIALIQDGVLGHVNEKQAKVLTTAKDSIDRLSRLITSLLDISKIEAGYGDINKSLISVTKTAQQVALLFESKANDKGVALRVKLPGTGVDAYADQDKIIQVFTNLVGNAIKFTEKGYIEISVVETEDTIECGVEDTGKGVSKADIPKMFVKFQQIDRVHGDGEKGTGLGLSIAKSIIEAHEGRMWAESEIDKGTKIIFTLPKYTGEMLMKEYVNQGLEEAKKTNAKMSLMVVRVDPANKTKELLSEEEIYSVLKGVEDEVKNSLDRARGAALRDSRECIVIIPNSSMQSVLSAEGRLKQAVDDYLTREKLTDKVALRFGCATYPDEAATAEDLIKHALKN